MTAEFKMHLLAVSFIRIKTGKRTLKTALQILAGISMWALSMTVCYYLGLILNGPGQPNLETGVNALVLLVATQWIAQRIFRRHLILQVLFGLTLSAMLVTVWIYLGPFWEPMSSDGVSFEVTWRSDIAFALMIAATQLISFWAFRKRIALQILGGAVLCVVLAIPLLFSEIMLFEKHLPDGSIIVGWRADVLFLLLVIAAQGFSFLAFRWIRRHGRRPPAGTVISADAPVARTWGSRAPLI
jgi:hypothetical protein